MKVIVTTDTLTPALQAMIRKLQDPETALRGVGEEIVATAKDAFSSPDLRPEAWPPLKPSTLARKAKKKYGSEPLIASGALARSPRVLHTVNNDTVVVGSDRRAGSHSLAGIHQLGAPKANIPPRPFFPFDTSGKATAKAVERVREILKKWLGGA